MLKLPVPKTNFHTEVISPSEMQKEMIAGLAKRAEEIRSGNVDPSVDNMLKITNDGRKLALDMRLINPLAGDDETGKVATCAGNIHRIWEDAKDSRSTQLVFCDLSTPKNDGNFNVYDDIKKKLIAKGVPQEEIAYIHTANTEVKKKELFAKKIFETDSIFTKIYKAYELLIGYIIKIFLKIIGFIVSMIAKAHRYVKDKYYNSKYKNELSGSNKGNIRNEIERRKAENEVKYRTDVLAKDNDLEATKRG